MGMKRKRLVYIKKFGRKFAAWLSSCGKVPAPSAEPAPEPEAVIEPQGEE